ncbi:MAG: PAS domain S-box protein, partial [Candidatus Aegiribacteria sp.]|nr:PAS domain S-box protein [Candidatus Aegiribacteria sp.]
MGSDKEFPASPEIEWDNLLTILESIDEVIYVADPDTHELLYMNPSLMKAFSGRTGKKCYAVLQDRKTPCPFCTNDLIFAEDAELPHIWLFKNRVNDRWYKCIDRPIRWNDGRLVRFEMAIDINDRILAEMALKENEEKFRVMVNASFDAIYLESMEGEVLDCNSAACEMLGYNRRELIGMNASELLPKDRLKDLPVILEKLKKNGQSLIQGKNLRKDGKVIPVESWARVIQTSEGERVLVYVRDITQRLESKRELVKSEQRFRSFMDQLPAAVFLKDSKSRYQYINPYMREVFNADESWIGNTTESCFPLDEAEALVRDDREALEKGYSVDIQNVIDRSGNERIFETHKFRITKSHERPMLGGVALDITNRVRAEQAQQSLEAQIQHTQKLESLGVLAGGIAHDFNNILMAILGYADLALQDIPRRSEARSSILEIEKAARNAADLTKQMLAYSGKGKFQVVKIDVNDIISEMTHLLEISISKKAVIKFNLA